MSIADKLSRLEDDIRNAYDTLDTKGATIPDEKNTINLADAIDTISSSANAVSVDRFIGATQMDEPGIKWISCYGNGEAVPCVVEENIIRGFTSMCLYSALTGSKVYEVDSVDWSDDFWIPIMILNVSPTNNRFESLEPPMRKYGCLHYDESNSLYEFCMMDSFGENATKTNLEEGEQFLITKEPSLFCADISVFGGYHTDPSLITYESICANSVIVRPDYIDSPFKCCSISMELPSFEVCCPIQMNDEVFDYIRSTYGELYYQNGCFSYDTGSGSLGICLQSMNVESRPFVTVEDAIRETIIWE